MKPITAEEKMQSKILVHHLLRAMGKDHTVNTVSLATGISKDTLSKWINGFTNLVPSNQVKVRAFIDSPPDAKAKWKDSNRNKGNKCPALS